MMATQAIDQRSSLFGTLNRRQKLEMMRQQMENERSSFLPEWMDICRFIAPRRGRFWVQDTDRGERRNQAIIDATASFALRDCKSGMMGGITSPARQWFNLSTPNSDDAVSEAVQEWLYDTTRQMTSVYQHSNLYNVLPITYGDMASLGTSAMFAEEDDEEVIRFSSFPIGSYCIALDDKRRVNTFYRNFEMPVQMLVRKFGKKLPNGELDWDHFNWENFSYAVQNAVQNCQWNTMIQVIHFVLPNDMWDPKKDGPEGKRFSSIYYEQGQGSEVQSFYNGPDADRFLRIAGYDLFPVFAPRWETTAEDAYGTEYPGVMAIGDTKSLQVMHKRKLQAVEKIINPPLTAPSTLRNNKVSLLPGDITWLDNGQGQAQMKPVHEVNWRINEIDQTIQETQNRIDRAFFADLFRMMLNDERQQPATATEINEKKQEQMLALGPVLEQLNQDLLDPLIAFTFSIMYKQGKIKPPPPELQGMPLRIEYTSIMAQAQKLLGISTTERFFQFAQGVCTIFQSAADTIDADEVLRVYGEQVSLAPKIIRDPDQTAKIRQSRQAAQQAQQQAQAAQQQAETAKTLAGAPTDQPNALTDLMAKGQAGNVVPQQ